MKKIILTTGGTGGHIYPALAVAEELKKKGIEILFVGTKNRMEKDIVPESGYRFIGLDIYPPKTIINIFKFLIGIFTAFGIILREKPDAIVGFGNYISVPILLAGVILRKRIYLQEQNANIGLTNKIFYKFCEKIFLAFESTYEEIPIKYEKKLMVTGNPLRKEIISINRKTERENFKIEKDEKILLITGGSLGAKDINSAILEKWSEIMENKNIRVYWATGKNNYDEIVKKIDRTKPNDVIKPYFNNMINIMAASDLVICRAGALTISEIIELEKPSILIPYNSIKVGQYENAKILKEASAAYVYKNSEADLAVEKALELIEQRQELEKISTKIKNLKKNNAAEEIAKQIGNWER